MMVGLFYLDDCMQCFMYRVNWDFFGVDVLVQVCFKDPYLCNPELDSFETWTVVIYWSQLLNFYTVLFFGVTSP